MKSNMSDLTRKLKSVLAPLGRSEERHAVKVALSKAQSLLQEEHEPRSRILGAELRIEKPPKRGRVPERLISVFIVDYAHKRILDVVSKSFGKATTISVLTNFQPAFHPDEIKEAQSIAKSDSRVAKYAKMRGVVIGAAGPPMGEHMNHRVIGLHYLRTNKKGQNEPVAVVAVDLYDRQVVRIEKPDSEARK